jgi:hypothetical protein
MKMHTVVYDQLGASAYTKMLLCASKKPGFAIRKTFDAFVITLYRSTLDWSRVSLMDVPLLPLLDALIVPAFIVWITLFPIITCL